MDVRTTGEKPTEEGAKTIRGPIHMIPVKGGFQSRYERSDQTRDPETAHEAAGDREYQDVVPGCAVCKDTLDEAAALKEASPWP